MIYFGIPYNIEEAQVLLQSSSSSNMAITQSIKNHKVPTINYSYMCPWYMEMELKKGI